MKSSKLRSLGKRSKKVVKPAQRRKIAIRAVTERGLKTRIVCEAFGISESCYRYKAKLSDDNADIAQWLLKLTQW